MGDWSDWMEMTHHAPVSTACVHGVLYKGMYKCRDCWPDKPKKPAKKKVLPKGGKRE